MRTAVLARLGHRYVRLVFAVALAGVLVSVAAACGGDMDGGEAAGGEERVVGYSNPLAAVEGLRSVAYGGREAIEQLGLNWTINETDAQLSSDKQVADLDTLINLGVTGIMVWQLDPGAADAAYQRAVNAEIPVIGLNSESQRFASVVAAHTDTTCLVSQAQAAFIAERIPNAKVLAIGGPPAPSITLTTECFLEAAEELGLRILEKQDDPTGTQAGGQRVAETMLTKHPDVEAMWVFSDDGVAQGAAAALVATGQDVRTVEEDSGVIVVSRNGVQLAIDAIRNGILTATWDNNQPLVGAAALQLLKYHYVDGIELEDLPRKVIIPSRRWDLTNIEEYERPSARDVPLPLPESCPPTGCPKEVTVEVPGWTETG